MARYATNTDLNRIYRDFITRHYGTFLDDDPTAGTVFGGTVGTGQSDLDRDLDISSRYIDSKLGALGYQVPLQPLAGTPGTYDMSITDWCCNKVIYTRLIRSNTDDYHEGIPDWVQKFNDDAKELEDGIVSGNMPLDIDITAGESGIGFPTAGGTTGTCNFYNNRNYGGIYTNSQYEGRFVVQIDGTGDGNDPEKSTFKWSRDGGMSWEDEEVNTSTTWVSLMDGIKVRWSLASHANNQLEIDDWWYFDVVPPVRPSKQYEGYVKAIQFGRG